MRLHSHLAALDAAHAGQEMHALATELYPICRSITGDGVRDTLAILQRSLPMIVHEVPTGTGAFDWIVPKEWNIREAWIKNPSGETIVDFRRNNLHVMSYSTPIHARMPLESLLPHLHSLSQHPDWIPYRTSYYTENWGFCLPHRQLAAMEPGEYEVCVDSSLRDGSLTYGESLLPGESADEVLISCHVCHPSLCNDNLSGITLAAFLGRLLSCVERRYTYRFLFIPGTIGSIVWLSRNQAASAAIRHGIVLTCVGDRGPFTYKRSRRGNAEIDHAFEHVLSNRNDGSKTVDFSPFGYDERQFCSPGFNLPVGCLMRTPYGDFPEYHTSADNLDFIDSDALGASLATCAAVFDVLERNHSYRNLSPMCEPQLGRRGLYSAVGGDGIRQQSLAMLWVLNQSSGEHSLLQIAEKSRLPFAIVAGAAEKLHQHGLIGQIQGAYLEEKNAVGAD